MDATAGRRVTRPLDALGSGGAPKSRGARADRSWRLGRADARQAVGAVVALAVFVLACVRLVRAVVVDANSDNLYLAGMYRDVFIDHVSLATWTAQPAPSFFPDLPVFFLVRALTGHPIAALGGYAVLELLLGVASVVAIACLLDVADGLRTLTAALLSVSALAYFNAPGEFFHTMFYPSCHQSTVWISIGSALLIARQIKAKRFSPRAAAALVLLTALTTASDHLYYLDAAGLAVATTFCLFVGTPGRGRLALNLGAIGFGVFATRWAEKIPAWFGVDVEPYPPTYQDFWKRFAHTLTLFPPPDEQPSALALDTVALLVALVLGFAVCAIVAARFHPSRRELTAPLGFLSAAFVGIIVCVFVGVGVTGTYWNNWCGRYLQSLFILPFIALPIAWLLARRSALRLAMPALFAALPFVFGWPALSEKRKLLQAGPTTYPASIACIDGIARRYGAQFAYGGYWNGRRTTELSRSGLHGLQVTASLGVSARIVNRSWFARAKDATAFLVLTRELEESAIKLRFGEPVGRERCNDEGVWVYEGAPHKLVLP